MGYLVLLLLVLALYAFKRRLPGNISGDPLTGGMVGLKGVAQETFVVQGTILVRGEIWKATSRQGIIQRGESVRVTAMSQGLLLEVEKVDR